MTAKQMGHFLREEFLWPGAILLLGVLACLIWYGLSHATYAGGLAMGAALMVAQRQLDLTLERLSAYRRELREQATRARP